MYHYLKLDRDFFKIVLICVLCVLSIIIYGTIRCKTTGFKDPLTNSLADGELSNFLDGWGILHFLFYGVLTYNYPKKVLIIFIFGVIWEIIESIFHDHPFYISKCSYSLTTDEKAGWWYGRWHDIVMNSLGMCGGYYLQRAFV